MLARPSIQDYNRTQDNYPFCIDEEERSVGAVSRGRTPAWEQSGWAIGLLHIEGTGP
jgi:hypothetical protein